MFCPICGNDNPAGMAFCGSCGNPLPRPSQGETPSAPAAYAAPGVPTATAPMPVFEPMQPYSPAPAPNVASFAPAHEEATLPVYQPQVVYQPMGAQEAVEGPQQPAIPPIAPGPSLAEKLRGAPQGGVQEAPVMTQAQQYVPTVRQPIQQPIPQPVQQPIPQPVQQPVYQQAPYISEQTPPQPQPHYAPPAPPQQIYQPANERQNASAAQADCFNAASTQQGGYNAPATNTYMHPAPVDEDVNSFVGYQEPLTKKQRKSKKDTGIPKIRFVPRWVKRLGVLAILALIILAGFGVYNAFFGNGGFTEYKQVANAILRDGQICFVSGTKVLDAKINSDAIDSIMYSMDGKTMILTSDEGDLYLLKGSKLSKIASDVVTAKLSSSGKGVAYVTNEDEGYALKLYNVTKKKYETITDEIYGWTFVISPDGKSVAYVQYDGEDEDSKSVMLYTNGNSSDIASHEVKLVAMSNKGKQIYAIYEDEEGEAELWSINAKGEKTVLGEIDTDTVYFNDDCTQAMFYNNGKTYIANKGKEAVKYGSGKMRMVIPQTCINYACSGYGIVYPADSLFDHVYIVSGDKYNSAYLIKKNADKSVELASKVTDATLDNSGKNLYYCHDYEELRVLKISDGENAADKSTELCDEFSTYAVTSDRDKVFFIKDGCLYSVNGKKGGTPTEIAEDVEAYSLAISKKNIAYFIVDGELFVSKNGKGAERILDDCDTVYNTCDGIIYATGNDTLYGTTGSKELDKITEIE